MTTAPQRLQYLEAMGVTAWVARYQLPNARPTEACEWPITERPQEAKPPAERLYALLDEAEAAPQRPDATELKLPVRGTAPRRARQLLGLAGEKETLDADQVVEQGTPTTSQPLASALRFTLQIACLAQRWLIVLPGESQPEIVEQRLLSQLFRAADIISREPLVFEEFRWPLIEGRPTEAPLDEAREGLRAFIDGTHRRGWAPERVLLFGSSDALESLGLTEAGADGVGLPVWQGPALTELAHSAEAKRALWPILLKWRQEWQSGTPEADVSDA